MDPHLLSSWFSFSLLTSSLFCVQRVDMNWVAGEVFLGKRRNGFLQSLSRCGRAQNVLVEFYQVWKCIKLFRAARATNLEKVESCSKSNPVHRSLPLLLTHLPPSLKKCRQIKWEKDKIFNYIIIYVTSFSMNLISSKAFTFNEDCSVSFSFFLKRLKIM